MSASSPVIPALDIQMADRSNVLPVFYHASRSRPADSLTQQKLRKPDPANQVSESRIAANRVEIWMGFEELQDIGLLFVGLLEPVEGLFVIAKAQVSVHKCGSRNIACLPTLFQLREKPQRIGAPTGVGVRSDQDAGCRRAA